VLTQLQIRDFAIVESLDLELEAGMTVLTGETGAGKSILVDALGLALGDATDNTMIRSGCDRAEVSAAFDTTHAPAAAEWLQTQALDDSGECVLRRVLVHDGRSRSFINGRPVSMAQVKELARHLVDIHSQHAHQALLRHDYQRYLLDAYGGHLELAHATADLHREARNAQRALEELRATARERLDRLDLLRYQAGELQGLQMTGEEWQQLDEEQTRLSHLGQLQENCAGALNDLYESEASAHALLTASLRRLEEVTAFEPRLEESRALIDSSLIQIDEAVSTLRNYLDGLEMDPARLASIENRLAEIHDMARKYHVKPEKLGARLAEIETELAAIEQADEAGETLEQEAARLHHAFMESAAKLSKKRRRSADKLGKAITDFMQTLGMKGGRFEIDLLPLEGDAITSGGLERIEYRVSANPGHPLQPLTKVASGGELSRISLAIQVATAQCGAIPTLIFDEVDVGIGGGVAETVGQLLRRLGESRQVICITHLPHVAAQGHAHLKVVKSSGKGKTRSDIQRLDPQFRIEEIARMLGGRKMTKQTLAHAEEMIRGFEKGDA